MDRTSGGPSAEASRASMGSVSKEYSRNSAGSPTRSPGSPDKASTHNWSRPEPLGKPVIKHNRVKTSTGKYGIDGMFQGSVHPENSDPSTMMPSEPSTEHLELLRKWDEKRKADLKKKVSLKPVGRGNMRMIMEEREDQREKAEEAEHHKQELRKETERLKDLNFFQDLGKACFKESRYEPESNFGIETRLSFFEWLTPRKTPAAANGSRKSKEIQAKLKEKKQANHSLPARIPDTVVWGLRSDGKPSWFYTAPDGTVRRTDKISEEDIISRIGNRACMGALVAVVKRQAIDQSGCEVDILSTVELQELVLSSHRRRGGLVAVQRFVKARGNYAAVIRTAWYSANVRKAPKAWMMSNKLPYEDADEKNQQSAIPGIVRKSKVDPVERFLVHSTKMHSCSVDEMKGTLCEDASRLNDKIVKFLAVERGILVDELAADYIRDDDGRLWMIQVHALAVRALSKKCQEFDRLPGESSQTTEIAKRAARTRPDSREQSRTGMSSRDGLDATGARCSLTGLRIIEGRKVSMKPKDIAVIHDRRYRRGAKAMHFLADAASASKVMTPEEMTSQQPFSQEVRELLVTELKLERMQRDLHRLLGLQEIRCTVEDIQEHFDEHTRPATDADETASVALSSGSRGSSVTGASEAGEDEEGMSAVLPKSHDCYRLLVCVSSFENLEESSLSSWIAEGASSQVEICAAHQATLVDQRFTEGSSSCQNRKLRALHFWADSEQKEAWLGADGGASSLQLNLHDAASGSLVATSSFALGDAVMAAAAQLQEDSKTGSQPIVQLVQRAALFPVQGQQTDYNAEAVLLVTLENLGKRRPRRSRPPMPHASIWIPAPGFCTPDPLPGYWLELMALRTGDALGAAVAGWHQSALECTAGPAGETSAPHGVSFGLDGRVQVAKRVPEADAAEAVAGAEGSQAPTGAEEAADQELHPALALMATAKALLEAPEGDIVLETAIRQLLAPAEPRTPRGADDPEAAPREAAAPHPDGSSSSTSSQLVPAARLEELVSILLQGCEAWEGELFRALVALCRVEQLSAEQILAEVKACAVALEDVAVADQEMATLAAVVARIPPYELRRDFVAACQTAGSPPGVLDFQGLALFLQSVLPAADAAAIRQLIMQLCLIGPDGNFSISFDEFRMACEAIPIAENQGLEVGWNEGSADGGAGKEEQIPGIPFPGALLVTWAGYQGPASPANSDAAELPFKKPLLLQVFAYFGAQDAPQEPWVVGPVQVTESGEVQMIGEEGESTECFLVDGIQLDPGSQIPSLEIQILDAEDSSIQAVAWCSPAQFTDLLCGLHEQGVLWQLPSEDRGHCMEQTAALWRPNVDPAMIDVQPEGDATPRAVLMMEFIPSPGEEGSIGSVSQAGSQASQQGSQAEQPSLQASRSQVSIPDQREGQTPPQRHSGSPEAMEEWNDRVQSSSPAAKLLQDASLGDLVAAICCDLKAVREEDLIDFHLGLPENEDPGADRWDLLTGWLSQQGTVVSPEQFQRLRSVVESLLPFAEASPVNLIRELEMVDGRCTRPLSDVAASRWITPSVLAAIALGMPEPSWEDLVLVEPTDLQMELLDAGHSPFDVRAIIRLLFDYNKAQMACDEEDVRRQLEAEGYNLSPRDNSMRSTGSMGRPAEATCETIEEERTEDLEMEKEDPGLPREPSSTRASYAAANGTDEGRDAAMPDSFIPQQQGAEKEPAPWAEPSSDDVAGGVPLPFHMQQQGSADGAPDDIAGGVPMPFHMQQQHSEAEMGDDIAGGIPMPFHLQQQQHSEGPPSAEPSNEDIAGGVPMPFHLQQQNSSMNEDGIEEIEMEQPPPSGLMGGYSRAPEQSRDGSKDGGAANRDDVPAWLRD